LLSARNYIRLVTVRIEGKVAAVDMGCVYNDTYTLLAGGTNPDFPGIAKFINLHHIKWACEQKIKRVDFLCGDFNWKTLFHLTPAPLIVLAAKSPPLPQTMVSAYTYFLSQMQKRGIRGAPNV
jgi:hypothetical protein